MIFESKQPDSDGSTRLTQAEVDKLRKAIRDTAPQSAQPASLEALGFRAQAAFVKLATPSVDPLIHFPLQRYDQLLFIVKLLQTG